MTKRTRFMIASEKDIKGFLSGKMPSCKQAPDSKIINTPRKLNKLMLNIFNDNNCLDVMINKKYFCIIYFADEMIKICSIYDKNFNFVKKGNLKTIARFLGMEEEYVNVSNIETKPELFLKIYKALSAMPEPQSLADIVLNDCKNGHEYAQLLKKHKNPILKVCETENIGRSQLAKQINVKISVLENCLSRDTVSKNVLKKLKEKYNYV